MNYIIAPNKINVGDEIVSGRNKEIKIGNCMPLSDIPAGTDIHNIELAPNGGGKLARSAGSSAQISGTDENYCIIKLGSGEIRKIIILQELQLALFQIVTIKILKLVKLEEIDGKV